MQISLPVVRVLGPAEQPAAAASASVDEVKRNAPEALASNMAPLKSWEERLRNALALDGTSDEVASENDDTVAVENKSLSQILTPSTPGPPPGPFPKNEGEGLGPETPVAKKATSSSSPSFDFELDPSPSAVVKSKQKKLDLDFPKPLPQATPKVSHKPTTERASTSSKTLAEFAPGELASVGPTEATLPAKPEHAERAEVKVQPFAQRRVARSGFPKVAALAVGPVLGGVLGLYGLLWLGGAKADYVGLAQVLPASLLPVGFGEPSSGEVRDVAPLAEASSPGLMAKLREQPAAMKRDDAVKPASATEPVPPVISSVRIKADEFGALVDAAEAALPEFVAGDLSTNESVKRKGQAYMALCRLAEQIDFAQQLGLAPAVQAKASQALQIYQRTASQADLSHDLAHIAGRWWEYDKRPSPGIFLSGEVQETQPVGSGMLCWVKLSEQSTVPAIPIWFKHDRYQTGDRIGIVGSVVTDPDNIPQGFSGNQVVIAGYSFAPQPAF